MLAGVLQLTLGRAGLWWLSDKKREWKWVLLGCLAGVVLAVLFSCLLAQPRYGEPWFTLLGPLLLVFVPPLATGYDLSFWTESPVEPRKSGTVP